MSNRLEPNEADLGWYAERDQEKNDAEMLHEYYPHWCKCGHPDDCHSPGCLACDCTEFALELERKP